MAPRAAWKLYSHIEGLLHGWQVWIWISLPAGEKPWDKLRMKTHWSGILSYVMSNRPGAFCRAFSEGCDGVVSILPHSLYVVQNGDFNHSKTSHKTVIGLSAWYREERGSFCQCLGVRTPFLESTPCNVSSIHSKHPTKPSPHGHRLHMSIP